MTKKTIVITFALMETRKKDQKIKKVRRQKADVEKGVDTKKFCGVVKLKDDPLTIQMRLRDEWQ
ncbi:MAG: hypothetical protein ACXVBJ_05940 [Flavisolibacter sp.]